MEDILKNYKGEKSNYDCIKSELEYLIEELESVNRLKVTNDFCNEVLRDLKSIKLSIYSITD